jgi:acetyl/propionyl-CoA carboxylase alpha subunit
VTERRPPFEKILVANRGEIALRVFRSCREHGIRTVAVYSDGDRHAAHVAGADEAVHIGPTPSAQSYLRADKIIAAAKQTGAQAIHPGYGFLSERSSFVAACDAAGITFIGPGAHAMEVMGDKVRARKAMQAAGVPLVPGREDLETVETALLAAREIGYPLMLRPRPAAAARACGSSTTTTSCVVGLQPRPARRPRRSATVGCSWSVR